MATRRPPQSRRPSGSARSSATRRHDARTPAPRRRNAPPVRKYKRLPPRQGMPFIATLVITLLFGYIIVYMGRGAHSFFSPSVDLMVVRLDNMEMQQSVPGIIIRHEEVFHAGKDGRIVFDVNEFDRVREGVLVASIRDIEAVDQNERDMAALEQEILNVHAMRHATQTDPQVARVNANLKNRMDRNMHIQMQKNLSEIYALLDTVTRITENRNRMITTESLQVRGDLNREYDFLSAQREENSNDIYATRSGIMSPLIDGFEDNFTPHNMRELSREQVRMNVDIEAIIPGREVADGDAVFKIVGNTWYVATWMPVDMAHDFAVGTERILYLENTSTGRYERLPMRIEHIEPSHRETFVIFQSTRNVIEFMNQRNVNIRITDNVQEGFIIPTTAIATRRFYRIPMTHIHGSEEFFIMHRRDDGIQPIPVTLQQTTETHAYILEETFSLAEGDSISPVDPTEVFHIISDMDIKIVYGVYRTTMNSAQFREIDIEGESLEAGGQILLDPARNPSIRQFDSIVTDAAMVREGQVVR
ncbi:MAG: hypothetical protein LBI27_08260 [Clostridiales bacterium]|nr:hypothetical protein [Clostridiales bacterium]